MTKHKVPPPPKMSKAAEKHALEYIERCEKGPNGFAFQDFEDKILTFIQDRKDGRGKKAFTYTFEEYVLWEIRSKNRFYDLRSNYVSMASLARSYGLSLIRSECRMEWGVTPKYHAKVYHKLINDALVEADMASSIKLHWRSAEEVKYRREHGLVFRKLRTPSSKQVEKRGDTCVICIGREPSHAFVPCGHLILCNRCAKKERFLGKTQCPVCCTECSGTLKIHHY
jgi:hypothetical protein